MYAIAGFLSERRPVREQYSAGTSSTPRFRVPGAHCTEAFERTAVAIGAGFTNANCLLLRGLCMRACTWLVSRCHLSTGCAGVHFLGLSALSIEVEN